MYPFRAEPPSIGHHREYPLGYTQISIDMKFPGKETRNTDHSSENKSGQYFFSHHCGGSREGAGAPPYS